MINNNKILTVSYGTFSCTLEGFDDSFGTMKAIAEYFRDLAADDRYFGAEPPQPDAQMLARIAQREISRHVEAREDEGRIVLSAQDSARTAALAPAAQEATSPAPSQPEQVQPEAPEDAPVAEETDAHQDIAAEAAPLQEAPAEESVEPSDAKVTEAVSDVPDTAAETPAAAEPETVAEAPAEIVPSVPDTAVESFFTDAHNDQPAADEFEFEDVPEAETVLTDSIADKLKRIRAVVSQQAELDDTPAYTEDEHADADVPMAHVDTAFADTEDAAIAVEDETDIVTATLRDIEDALDTDDALELAESATEEEEEADDDVAALLTCLEAESGEAPTDADHLIEEDTLEDDALTGNILASMDDDEDDTEEYIHEETSAQETPADEENLFDGEEAPEDDAELTVADEEPTPAAPRTRVLKVKRATLDAAILSGQLEEVADDEDAAADYPKAPLADRSSLSDEAEAELARELAELEAEIGATDADVSGAADDADEDDDDLSDLLAEVDMEADDEHEDDHAISASHEDHAEGSAQAEDNFSRLMDEADSQMDEPESATRRDAFAHLRAAVAAKKADEAVGGATSDEESDEIYRDDLASVVRPRRPVASGNRTERPEDQRPAPLKLVAEQRIDVDQSVARGPVRPRRVAAVVDNTAADAPEGIPTFERFAEDVGASSLPELLEAAAAYLSFVEGHQQFSRPQLMTKVRMVEKENFTREDGLRSFGKLLREGKIEKIKGGRFQASEQIGFKPDARAAG